MPSDRCETPLYIDLWVVKPGPDTACHRLNCVSARICPMMSELQHSIDSHLFHTLCCRYMRSNVHDVCRIFYSALCRYMGNRLWFGQPATSPTKFSRTVGCLGPAHVLHKCPRHITTTRATAKFVLTSEHWLAYKFRTRRGQLSPTCPNQF